MNSYEAAEAQLQAPYPTGEDHPLHDLVPGSTSMLGRMLSWIDRSPSASPSNDESVGGEDPVETGPVAAPVGLDVSAVTPGIVSPKGFSSARMAREAIAYAQSHPLLDPTASLLIGPGQAAPEAFSAVVSAAAAKAVGSKVNGPASSLHPLAYKSLDDFLDSVFSAEFVQDLRAGSTTDSSARTKNSSPYGDMFSQMRGPLSDEVKKSLAFEQQMLHLLNIAHLRTVLEFSDMAQSTVRIEESWRERHDSLGVIHISHPGDDSSGAAAAGAGLPGRAATGLDDGGLNHIEAAFYGPDSKMVRSLEVGARKDLSGPASLFSMGRSVEFQVAAMWEDAFLAHVGVLTKVLARDILSEVTHLEGAPGGPIAAALASKLPQLVEDLGAAILKLGPTRRLQKSYKTILPIPSLNAELKAFNARMDRTALSHAMRYGNGVRFNYLTYRYFCADSTREAITNTPYKGAFSLLALRPELLARLHSSTVADARQLQTFVRSLHDHASAEVRERIAKESPQYLIGLAHTRQLAHGGILGELTYQAQESGRMLATALERLRVRGVSLRHLPLREHLFLHGALSTVLTGEAARPNPKGTLGALAAGTTATATKPPSTGLDETRCLEIAEVILRDLMSHAQSKATGKRQVEAVDSLSPAELRLDLDTYADAPSFEAIARYRGEVPDAHRLDRATADGLRTLLGLSTKRMEDAPLVTRVPAGSPDEAPGNGPVSTLRWRLGMIRRCSGEALADRMRDTSEYDGYSEVEDEPMGNEGLGATYVVSFVSESAKPVWIHSIVTVANSTQFAVATLDGEQSPMDGSGPPDEDDFKFGLYAVAARYSQMGTDGGAESYFSETDDLSFAPLVLKSELTPAVAKKGTIDVSNVLYRGLEGSGAVLQVTAPPKLGEARAAILEGHATQLRAELCQRLVAGMRKDPVLFTAVMASDDLDITQTREVLEGVTDVIPNAVALRAATCAARHAPTFGFIAARISDPFHTNAKGATLLDIAEWAQVPEKSLSANTKYADMTIAPSEALIEEALMGLASNPAAQADPVAFQDLIQRSARNCLVKAPYLLGRFEEMGLKIDQSILSAIDEVHPKQISPETRLQWNAARMQLRIEEAREKLASSGGATDRDPETVDEALSATKATPATPRRRRSGI